MSNWFDSDIAVLAVSIILSGILLPQILRVAYKRQLFDDNEARKIHSGHIPRLGGLSFFPASLFAFCLLIAVNLSVGEASFSENLSQHALALTYFACSVALMYIMGMVDDIVGLNFRVKLVIQILSAVLVVMSGTLIFNLDGLLWIWELPTWIAWFLSGFYVVLMVNAINFIDGLDGLATGLCVIALVFYAVILYMGGAFLYSMIACATIGPLLVFFYYNVFGTIERKKKVFMGDAGALTIGVVLAFLGLAVSELPWTVSGEDTKVNPFVLAYSPVLIPIFDLVRVYFHRVKGHMNPFHPNNVHIHHKLLALGYKQSVVLTVILAGAVFFLTSNIVLSPYVGVTYILLGDVVVWTAINLLLTRAIKAREAKVGHQLYIR